MAHSGILYKVQKKNATFRDHVSVCALASGTIKLIFNNLIWDTHSKLLGIHVIFSYLTHKFTLCKSINELLILISYIADNMWSNWSSSMLGHSDILHNISNINRLYKAPLIIWYNIF